MLSDAFISQQKGKLVALQEYYQLLSVNNGGVENVSEKRSILDQIRTALEMINDGGYGYCEDCDEIILIKRLI